MEVSMNSVSIERTADILRAGRRVSRQYLTLTFLRRHGVTADRSVRLNGLPLVSMAAGSSIVLGKSVVLTSRNSHNTLEARGPVILRTLVGGAEILIGDNSGLSSSTISAMVGVSIGSRTLLGGGVVVTDTDHHYVDISPSSRRFAGLPPVSACAAVTIEDDVFVGARAIVLKGVTIGRGSVIGAGSVVNNSIPPGVVAAGNPARVLRELDRGDVV